MTDGGAPRGAIHDLGYARYVGTRRPPATRWRVIARHEVAMAWKGWWRYKAPLALAVIGTFVCGAILYEASSHVWRSFGGGLVVTWMDSMLPLSFQWYDVAAFLVSLTIGGATIAGDVDGGALPFYFARSTRPVDYLAGKLAGYALVVATVAAAGPFALSVFRLGLSDDTHQLVLHLAAVPEALAVGALATLAYAAVPLGFSALIPSRRYALAAWAAYYLVVGNIASAIGLGLAGHGWIGALDLSTAIRAVAAHVFGATFLAPSHVPVAAAITSIVVQAAVALAIAGWRIGRIRAAGVGGGS